jgi:tetratricopeptide (TPR) repeat protein
VDMLEVLLDKSLLRRAGDRYWMLETIREFALERFAEDPDRAGIEGRHADYFLRLVEEAYRHVQGPEERPWFERLDPEHDNIRAALAHAADMDDPTAELRIAVAVAPFRIRRGYLSEAESSLERVLGSTGPLKLRIDAFHHSGWIANLRRDSERAERLLGESLALSRELDDPQVTARELLTLAGIVSDRDEDEAQALYDELLAFVEEHPEESFPNAFTNLADFAVMCRDFEAAIRFAQQGADLYRRQGETWGQALCAANLGLARLGLGDRDAALRQLQEALRLYVSVDDEQGIATTLSVTAAVLVDLGEIEPAIRLLAAAEHLIEEMEAELVGYEAALHERTLATVRVASSEFAAEWARGLAMTREEAVAEALSAGKQNDERLPAKNSERNGPASLSPSSSP